MPDFIADTGKFKKKRLHRGSKQFNDFIRRWVETDVIVSDKSTTTVGVYDGHNYGYLFSRDEFQSTAEKRVVEVGSGLIFSSGWDLDVQILCTKRGCMRQEQDVCNDESCLLYTSRCV